VCLAPIITHADETSAPATPLRIVSLNPSLTSILIALEAGDRLVGVDDFSARLEPTVADLPRVGGLFNPSLEAVVSLGPDVVVLVPSVEQRDFRARLEGLGVRVEVFRNFLFAEVLSNIEQLGALVGRESQAKARVAAIEARRRAFSQAALALRGLGREPPGVVLVLQRDPLFVVGSGNFIDEMLASIGVRNLGSEFQDPYPRVSMEWLIAAAPDVLVDLGPNAGSSLDYWSQWGAIPAVANERLVALDPEFISMPGPHLDDTLDILARAIWGEEIESMLAGGRAADPLPPSPEPEEIVTPGQPSVPGEDS